MLVLTIRTDKPESEIGLFDDDKKLAYETWQAHRELSDTIHLKIKELLVSKQKELTDIEGIVAYLGPGSFTGLRIGLSVANALADGLGIPIVGAQSDSWLQDGLNRLRKGENDKIALPEYGAPVHITAQKH
jgi:tRNA threonylcarbamoyladenosine biosynthesis protein TsaB